MLLLPSWFNSAVSSVTGCGSWQLNCYKQQQYTLCAHALPLKDHCLPYCSTFAQLFRQEMAAFMVLLIQLSSGKITESWPQLPRWKYYTLPGSWSAVVLYLIRLVSASHVHICLFFFCLERKGEKKVQKSRGCNKFLCVSQMEFACSHVVCNWRPDGAGEFPLWKKKKKFFRNFACEIRLCP